MPIDFYPINPIHHSPLGIQRPNNRMHPTFQAFADEAYIDLLRPKVGRRLLTLETIGDNSVFSFPPETHLMYNSTNFEDIDLYIREMAKGSNGKIIINLENVAIADSGAINLLFQLHKELNNRVILANLNKTLQEIFRTTKLDKLFTIKPTVEEALS